jgi:flagellar basal-body rod modification protein FlgD
MELSASTTSDLGREQFLQLLVAQLQNQDPLEPVKNENFVAQLAQFSTLEGIEKLNVSFEDIFSLQQLTQGSNLIGRQATFVDAATNETRQGAVESFSVDGDRLQLKIDGTQVPISQVVEISA